METTGKKTPKDYIHQTLLQTNTSVTKLLDRVDTIDRKIYGRRMKLFIWSCILVLILAPVLDWVLGTIMRQYPNDLLTFISTLAFLFFILILILAFVGSWRDDTGNWTWKRAKSRLQTYYETFKDEAQQTKTNSGDELLYKLGLTLFFGALAWKTFQNLSVFVRKPIESLFGTRLISFRNFEKSTNQYYWIILLVGVAVIIYLYKKNPQILERIKNELRQLFGWKQQENFIYKNEAVAIVMKSEADLVINAKIEAHINTVIASSKSNLFTDFVKALQTWHPRSAYYEYEFQDSLYRHLRKNLHAATVELEYPIGSASLGNKGRADIVINETILIEMKRDGSAGAIQRAKGQVSQYSEIWKGKGPVILLLCNYEYEHARLSFTPTMTDLLKLERPVLTICN